MSEDLHLTSPELRVPDRTLAIRAGAENAMAEVEVWDTPGKSVDLSKEAFKSGPYGEALLKVEGDDRPRFLIGRGFIVDVPTSLKEQRPVFLQPRHIQGTDTLVVTIGESAIEKTPPIAGVMKWSGQITGRVNGQELLDSPFENVKNALHEGVPGLDNGLLERVSSDSRLYDLYRLLMR